MIPGQPSIKADRAEYQPGQRCHELVFHAESINGNGDGRFYASALTDFSTEKPGLLLERLYHVVAICENAGNSKVYLTSAPEKHHLACVIMSKFSSHPARRLQLEEVSSTTRADQGVSNVIG